MPSGKTTLRIAVDPESTVAEELLLIVKDKERGWTGGIPETGVEPEGEDGVGGDDVRPIAPVVPELTLILITSGGVFTPAASLQIILWV